MGSRVLKSGVFVKKKTNGHFIKSGALPLPTLVEWYFILSHDEQIVCQIEYINSIDKKTIQQKHENNTKSFDYIRFVYNLSNGILMSKILEVY